MALLDVEGVPVHLGEIMVENLMASWQSVQDILVRHYSRQILHELYKVNASIQNGTDENAEFYSTIEQTFFSCKASKCLPL
jgi:hypothetical protein